LVTVLLRLPVGPAYAQSPVDFFHPLVTRRAVIEREIEVQLRHEESRAGREIAAPFAVDFPLLPRWKVELEIPVIFTEPNARASAGGLGDIGLENKFQLVNSVEHQMLLSAGFDIRAPSGSAKRGLGGNVAVTPFVAAGVKLGRFDVQAEAGYSWIFATQGSGEDAQQVAAGLAVGSAVRRWLTPFVEATTISRVRGAERDNGVKVLGRPQVYLTPGLNLDLFPRATWLLGVQLPVTPARMFDYQLRAGLVWEF